MSLDLDNKWSYMKTHGDAGWESFPSYLDIVVPRFLDVLDELGLTITVFIVGQDAALEKNYNALRNDCRPRARKLPTIRFIMSPGCIFIHLMNWIANSSCRKKRLSEQRGKRTVGFRGPGFSLSDQTLKVLVNRGYKYDCSAFPTFLGPAARAYYFMSSSLSKEERNDRKVLFGKFSDGFQTNNPYFWMGMDKDRLVEIPVTTFPFIKTPFHASYLLYLASFNALAAKSYLWSALKVCRLSGVEMSMLLHPLDFLGSDDNTDLDFFPAMNMTSDRKIAFMKTFLKTMSDNFDIITMRAHATHAATKSLSDRSIQLARTGLSWLNDRGRQRYCGIFLGNGRLSRGGSFNPVFDCP